MAKIKSISIEGFRSIRDEVTLRFPDNKPIVLIGENNCGKSNVIRALDVLFGEFHPKYKDIEHFDHHGRDSQTAIVISTEVSGYQGQLGRNPPQRLNAFKFKSVKGAESEYVAILEDNTNSTYISNDLRGELTSIIVNAEHNLAYQLSYTSKYTLLSKVMKVLHKSLVSDEKRVERLKALYLEIQNTFDEVPEFKGFKGSMSSISGQILANMSYMLQIDFSAYDPSNYFKSLRVNPVEGIEARSFEELGTGQQQLLALAFAHAYCKSFINGDIILILDEPESHLHPLAQKWLSRMITKMASDGLQIVITTHSANFIDLLNIEGLYLLRKDGQATTVTNHSAASLYKHCIATGANSERTKEETVVPFYANHSTTHILNGFFAKKIVLVEGLTEELALPIYLERVGLDVNREGIEILGVQGKGNLAKWWRLFTLYGIPTFVCFDNDDKHDKQGNQRTDSLKAIGIADEELANIIGTKDWAISDGYCVFGVDFETTMKASFKDYDEVEQLQKATLGTTSKHIIAREVAKVLKMEKSEGWKSFDELRSKLISLGDLKQDVAEKEEHNVISSKVSTNDMLEELRAKFGK
ncbi:putative ATP-dependent endonuclease of OLD family [Pedobacter sp. AK017]|uniref:ATP-dependent nuclease n=1 Tax=Pedobacter sp. AK017 TaxID=2723073 RepID=UPI00162212F6|nr:AAA family ATPase [Pedobacter sp. AK017]MBB5437936.1 putative ATP-dependent endonuclease of OLD family [Pedobacter sp. AK017]